MLRGTFTCLHCSSSRWPSWWQCRSVLSSGKLRWSYTLPGYFLFTTPAVDQGIVYVGPDAGRITALDAPTGKLIWSFVHDRRGEGLWGDGRHVSW